MRSITSNKDNLINNPLCKETNLPMLRVPHFEDCWNANNKFMEQIIHDSDDTVSGSNTIQQGMEAKICGVLS